MLLIRVCPVVPNSLLSLLLLIDAATIVRSFCLRPDSCGLSLESLSHLLNSPRLSTFISGCSLLYRAAFVSRCCIQLKTITCGIRSPIGAGATGRTPITMNAKNEITDTTLVFCRRTAAEGSKEILLGKKKRGFGMGKWNGFGGKIEVGETKEQAAKRELLEESFINATELSLRGVLTFTLPSYPTILRVYVYEAMRYTGEPGESEEMRPQWFNESQLPEKEMWADDAFWMPLFLDSKIFRGEFDFADEETIVRHTLREFPSADALLASS